MRKPVEIQNIEEMRRQEGIDDFELRVGIRALKAGDLIKLSLLTGTASFETRVVQITSIRGSAFRGRLLHRKASTASARLRLGAAVAFTTDHIHSIAKKAAQQ